MQSFLKKRAAIVQTTPEKWRYFAILILIPLSVSAGNTNLRSVSPPAQSHASCAQEGFIKTTEYRGDPSKWGKLFSVWGKHNIEQIGDPSASGSLTRIWFAAGTYDPGSMFKQGKKTGGTGYATLFDGDGFECAVLRYRLRFSDDFDFVRGGKLPGLAGGLRLSYPKLPRGGETGFTARLMWRERGGGEVYAYLLNTPKTGVYYGESIGRDSWSFLPGTWYSIEEQLILNHPEQNDGIIRVFVDGQLKLEAQGVRIRSGANVRIDGLIFESFFGGNDPSWATQRTVYIDFADFSLDGYIR